MYSHFRHFPTEKSKLPHCNVAFFVTRTDSVGPASMVEDFHLESGLSHLANSIPGNSCPNEMVRFKMMQDNEITKKEEDTYDDPFIAS